MTLPGTYIVGTESWHAGGVTERVRFVRYAVMYTVRLLSALSVTFGDSSPEGRAKAGSSFYCLRQRLGIGAPNAAANGMSDYIAGEELQLFQCADQISNPH